MMCKGRHSIFVAFCVVTLVLVFQFSSKDAWSSTLPDGEKLKEFAIVQEKPNKETPMAGKDSSLSFLKNVTEAVYLRGPVRKEIQNISTDRDYEFLSQDVASSIGSFHHDKDNMDDSDEKYHYERDDELEDEPYNTDDDADDEEDDEGYTYPSKSVVSKEYIDRCRTGVAVEATLTNYTRKHYLNNLVHITQIAKEDNTLSSEAVCRFSTDGNYLHFPHVMQSYTRCFSFFRRHADRTPVIVKRRNPRFRDTFNMGIFDIFRDVFNGTIVNSHKYDEKRYREAVIAEPYFEVGMREEPDQQGIAFQNPKHAQILRRKTAEYYHIEAEGCRAGKGKPVIGILSRNSTRTLSNAQELREVLSKLSDKPVDIVYFENKTFHEQVSFMMQTDILVSSHGAQLSSINFMEECGGVLEVFPRGYFFPHFFGPLAATSGLFHGYVYTGEDLEKEWYQGGAQDPRARARSRKMDVCVPLETSMDVIRKLIENWKSCCRMQLADDTPPSLTSS